MSISRPYLPWFVVVVASTCVMGGCGDGQSKDVVARAPDAPDAEAAAQAPVGTDAGLVVDVAGAVRRPGVYRMQPGARVHEAIAAAGGARPGAALGMLNRAAVLVDGQQVVVGAGGAPTSSGSAPAGTMKAAGDRVNLNTADEAQLDELPGIGEVTAAHIVASREESGPFTSVDDLDRVPGIGPATLESLRDAVTT